ncbi:MAG: HEAT repeat domain-containing protein [bacterium]|nr:HEAT repeat domain-containing protein [bacterium]
MLGELGGAWAVEPLRIALKNRERVVFALRAIGAPAVETLAEILASRKNSGSLRKEALHCLAAIKDGGAIKALLGALKDESGTIRREAIAALMEFSETEIKDDSAIEPLFEALKDESATVRRNVISVLKNFSNKLTCKHLQEVLKRKDKWIRHHMISLFYRHSDRCVARLLKETAGNDPEKKVRSEALRVLKQIEKNISGKSHPSSHTGGTK